MEDFPHRYAFQIPHGAFKNMGILCVQHPPEEITLADGTDISAIPGDDRDHFVAVVTHLFQSLTESTVVVEKGRTVLGEQKISYVHAAASFLEGGDAACSLFSLSISIIWEVPWDLVNNL